MAAINPLACICSATEYSSIVAAQVLKTYQSDRPMNSADVSPIFDHVIMGGGQEASQARSLILCYCKFFVIVRPQQPLRVCMLTL